MCACGASSLQQQSHDGVLHSSQRRPPGGRCSRHSSNAALRCVVLHQPPLRHRDAGVRNGKQDSQPSPRTSAPGGRSGEGVEELALALPRRPLTRRLLVVVVVWWQQLVVVVGWGKEGPWMDV